MKGLKRYLYQSYIVVINSIAFYPTLISFGFLLFSFISMSLEYKTFMNEFKKEIAIVLVNGEDNARLILGTIVGSMISLMVFSFSMVMLVLGRASATLSPRVLPGLITQKSHQVVLGVYLGTIIHSLILIINMQSAQADYQVPSLGVLFAMIFTIFCLALFVYFIHSISKTIQTDSILKTIFTNTLYHMENLEEDTSGNKPDIDDWISIETPLSGYLKQVNTKDLTKICQKEDIQIAITVHIGYFMVENYPFVKVNKDIDKELKENILQCFIFFPEEHVSDHYIFGFKQVSEIAIKALSPGINDPGTAVKALDFLSILFIRRMELSDHSSCRDEEGTLRISFREPTVKELLYLNLTQIRHYGCTDSVVMYNLLQSLKNIIYADKQNCQIGVLSNYVKSVVDSCDRHIQNSLDRGQLNIIIERINDLLKDSDKLALLK